MTITPAIARRIRAERAVVRKCYRALKAAGYTTIEVYDGEEATPAPTEKVALDAVFAVDEARMYAKRPGEEGWSWILFILGEYPDTICDYTTDLDDALKPIFDALP